MRHKKSGEKRDLKGSVSVNGEIAKRKLSGKLIQKKMRLYLKEKRSFMQGMNILC